MKTTLTTALCVSILLLGTVRPAQAIEDNGPTAVAVDAVFARPACFIATVVGSALFVVSLPAAIPSKSVKKAADTLVGVPARATFSRPLGDFSSMSAD
jgi:hypothetical protein